MMPEPPDPQDLPAALSAVGCRRWLARLDALDRRLGADDPARQPTSGSLRLAALGPARFALLLRALWQGPAGAAVRDRAGEAPWVLPGQSWLRRQHPPARRPAGQHPHAWHQDGALGCRFDGSAEGLAPIVTLWVPLVDCGDDAPSLEWVDAATTELLPPSALADAAVRARFGADSRRQARLAAGDALLFGGALLHRSHVAPEMRHSRSSIELRFLPAQAVPQRLESEVRWRVPPPIKAAASEPVGQRKLPSSA